MVVREAHGPFERPIDSAAVHEPGQLASGARQACPVLVISSASKMQRTRRDAGKDNARRPKKSRLRSSPSTASKRNNTQRLLRDPRPRDRRSPSSAFSGDVKRALLLQELAGVAEDAADHGRQVVRGRARRGRGRPWRRRRPPSWRATTTPPTSSPTRRLTSIGGIMATMRRAVRRQLERPALRRSRPPQDPPPGCRRGVGHRWLWQLRRRPTSAARSTSMPATTATSWSTPCGARTDKIFYSAAKGIRPSRCLRWIEDRARRHPQHHLAEFDGSEKRPASGRSLHREAPDRGLPRAHGHRRHHRHPGHGRGGAHLVDVGDVVELDLDHVPQRETGMTAYEMMLSESQERMLMI